MRRHGNQYVVFGLGEKTSAAKVLSDPTAEVCVCSTRWTGRIDAEFYSRPLPVCGGKSIPNIFEKLRPYFRKWKSAQAFNPVQMEFFDFMDNTHTEVAVEGQVLPSDLKSAVHDPTSGVLLVGVAMLALKRKKAA